ncbi:MAG: hypothetical protein C0624_03890 [Desulfuromonas sp.]|nr:MAG: hypothetical protein C0624_03890 [Desulfuromonas sp.]
MKKWRASVAWGLTAFLLVLGISATSHAANISGRSSTVVEWYDTPSEETAVPIYEYLMLNARDLWGGWTFHGYGRAGEDAADEVDVDSRLYSAYLRNKDLVDGLDMRLGRQFVSTTAGASVVDGADLRYTVADKFTLRGLGGIGVSYDATYHSDDYFAGVEVSAEDLIKGLLLELSYVQTWDQGDLAKEMLGLSADYAFSPKLHLYNETQYSLLYEEVTYQLFGVSSSFGRDWHARVEYLFSVPVFDSTSIYSVFAVDDYEEVMGEIEYRISKTHRSYLRLTHEMYEEFDDADVIDLGIETVGTKPYSYYLAGVMRITDEGQEMSGAKCHIGYEITEAIEAGVGANVDVLERRLEDDDETTSSRIWLDGSYRFSKKMNFEGKVEYVESDLWEEYYRGRVRFNYYF